MKPVKRASGPPLVLAPDRVRAFRRDVLGMASQEQLAAALGCTRKYIARMETDGATRMEALALAALDRGLTPPE